MTTQLYINCFIGGLIGMLFYLFAIKLPAIKKRAIAANLPFNIKNYFKEDYLSVGASLITILALVWALDEIIGYNPSFMRYIKFFFVFVGYTGQSLLISILGNFDVKVRDIVDKKTNIADNLADNKEGGSSER